MTVSKEKQAILDLLEDVCELAENGELGFEYRSHTASEGVKRWMGDTGALNPGLLERSWKDVRNMLCPKVAPGLKLQMGTLFCRVWYDYSHNKDRAASAHGGWGKWYLRELEDVPLWLRYRLNRALLPMVKRRESDDRKKRWKAEAEAACNARIRHEQAVLQSMKGQQ